MYQIFLIITYFQSLDFLDKIENTNYLKKIILPEISIGIIEKITNLSDKSIICESEQKKLSKFKNTVCIEKN